MSYAWPICARFVGSAMFAIAAAAASTAWAAPISIAPTTLNMFRDTRGPNDVGDLQGDIFQYGADIIGGSRGASSEASHAGGDVGPTRPCAPLATNADFCANAMPFNGELLTSWTLTFTNGPDRLDVPAPSVVGAEEPVPFPASVRVSGGGVTPTVAWEIPSEFVPDGIRINVFDKSDRLVNKVANIIHTVVIQPTSMTYTIPTALSSGRSLVEGQAYSIAFQLIETRGHVPFRNNNADILRRSTAYFAFTPRGDADPSDVILPTDGS